MKFRIIYWDAGGRLQTREVEAEDEQAAILKLMDDEQAPLAQVKSIKKLDKDDDDTEFDQMQAAFIKVYGEPQSRKDPEWLGAFGLFACGWSEGKTFQQGIKPAGEAGV